MTQPTCSFCDILTPANFDSLDKHLQYGHGISKKRELALAILLLKNKEEEELMNKTRTRFEEYKSTGRITEQTEDNTNEEIDDIQQQIEMDMDISDDETDDEMLDIVNNKEKETEIEIIDLSDDDDTAIDDEMLLQEDCDYDYNDPPIKEEPVVQQEETVQTTKNAKAHEVSRKKANAPVISSKKEPSVDKNKINLVEKFASVNYQCRLCYVKYPNEDNLRRHEEVIHKDDQKELSLTYFSLEDLVHLCDLCVGVRYLSENILRTHRRLQHGIKEPLRSSYGHKEHQCKLCYRICSTENNLKIHQDNIHKNEKEYLEREITAEELKFSCEKCGLKFIKQSIVDFHQRAHRAEEMEFLKQSCSNKRGFKCVLCYSTFKHFNDMCNHAEGYHSEDMEYFKNVPQPSDLTVKCEECSMKFVSSDASIYHRINVHYSVDNLVCHLCDGKEFKNRTGALIHRYRIHKTELWAFKLDQETSSAMHECKHCEKKYITEGSLAYHKYRSHSIRMKLKSHKVKKQNSKKMKKIANIDKTEYNCSFCDQILVGKDSLLEHCSSIHEKRDEAVGDDKVSCGLCSKVVKSKQIGVHRLLKHTSGESHECKLCYEKFKIIYYLNSHMKNVHISVEEIEFLKTGNQSMLQFECNSCELKFISERLLKKHTNKYHKEVDRESDVSDTPLPKYCNLCYINFQKPSYLKEHRTKVHTTPEEIATFTQDEVKHSLLKYKCTLCNQKLISRGALKYHRQYAHKDEMKRDKNSEITCEFCNKVFLWKNRGNMKSHIKLIHKVDDYDIAEHTMQTPQTDAVSNFMDILNSL